MNIYKQRFLVTGANGFVGQAFCMEAIARGINISGATRRHCELLPNVKSFVVGDINGETDWSMALKECDVIIHLAARVHVMFDGADDPLAEFRKVNIEGTEHLARCAAASGVKRFVYVSSIGVNGFLTNENSKFCEERLANPHSPYALSKWEAEKVLKKVASETGLDVVIVRPPLVYGLGAPGNFAQMLHAVSSAIPLPLASIKNKRDLIYIGNLVDVLLLCAKHPMAVGQTYLVSDGESISTPNLLKWLAEAIGRKCRIFPMPITILKVLAKVFGKSAQLERLTGSLQIDSSKIRRELGWIPPYTLKQGLQNTVQKVN